MYCRLTARRDGHRNQRERRIERLAAAGDPGRQLGRHHRADFIIGGFIVLGPNSQNVITRAIGPSPPVAGKLANPTLELHDKDGAVVMSNDDWRSGQEDEIIATGVAPIKDRESA